MKNVFYFAVIALLFACCQQTVALKNKQHQRTANLETVVNYHAGILLKTEAGEDIFNAISLADYPEAWSTDQEGAFVPNMDVISELLDYVKISKHNEKTVLKQSIIVYNPDEAPRA